MFIQKSYGHVTMAIPKFQVLLYKMVLKNPQKFLHTMPARFPRMLNCTNIYTVKKGCENRIFGFPQKYHVKTTQDTTQVTFRTFQAKLGPVKFFPKFFPKFFLKFFPKFFA